jgi:hypothetical protein
MVQVIQSAAIYTNGINKMTCGGHVFQDLTAMWVCVGDMHVTNVHINHERRIPYCFKNCG